MARPSKKTDENTDKQESAPVDAQHTGTQYTGWTAQSEEQYADPQQQPGQTFTEDELPDPEIQRAAGINPEQYRNQIGLAIVPSEKDGARNDGNTGAAFAGSDSALPTEESLKGAGVVETYVRNPDHDLGPTQAPGVDVNRPEAHPAQMPRTSSLRPENQKADNKAANKENNKDEKKEASAQADKKADEKK